MKEEDITVLAQLMTGIKDAIDGLEDAQKKKNQELLERYKREIIVFQKKIDEVISK